MTSNRDLQLYISKSCLSYCMFQTWFSTVLFSLQVIGIYKQFSEMQRKQKNIVTEDTAESIISDQSNRNKACLTKNQNPKCYGEDLKKPHIC